VVLGHLLVFKKRAFTGGGKGVDKDKIMRRREVFIEGEKTF